MLRQMGFSREIWGRGLQLFLISVFCLFCWGMVKVSQFSFNLNCPYTTLLAWGLGNREAESGEPLFLSGALVYITGVDPRYLPGVLEKGLPAIPFEEDAVAAAFAGGASVGKEERPLQAPAAAGESGDASKQPVEVALYHTHNAETYIPLHGKSKVDGKNGGVGLAAEEMVKVLEKAGIKAVHDRTLHDYPDFPTSYIKSEATARRLVQENPALKALVDVHRDAGLSKRETVKVGGQEAARILLVVGNGERLPNPHWRENYAFAQEIANRLEEKYPGILKGVRLKPGRYNQHLSPRALLVEVGGDKNTPAEALGAARCFATVLAELIREERAGAER